MAINKWFFCIYNKVFNEITVQRYEIIRKLLPLPALFFLDGKFGIAPEVKLELHKEWKPEAQCFQLFCV